MRKKKSIILWSVALVFLAAVMIFVNLPKSGKKSSGSIDDGRIKDFSITCLDGSTFSLSGQKEKVVVINLWATWCIPCINELPDLDRIQREYEGDVTVIAIHTPPVTEDVSEWLSDRSYEMKFAVDEDGNISEMVSPSSVLPHTVVIDRNGTVVYDRAGSIEYVEFSDIIANAVNAV